MHFQRYFNHSEEMRFNLIHNKTQIYRGSQKVTRIEVLTELAVEE